MIVVLIFCDKNENENSDNHEHVGIINKDLYNVNLNFLFKLDYMCIEDKQKSIMAFFPFFYIMLMKNCNYVISHLTVVDIKYNSQYFIKEKKKKEENRKNNNDVENNMRAKCNRHLSNYMNSILNNSADNKHNNLDKEREKEPIFMNPYEDKDKTKDDVEHSINSNQIRYVGNVKCIGNNNKHKYVIPFKSNVKNKMEGISSSSDSCIYKKTKRKKIYR